MPSHSPWIIDATQETFEQEILRRSDEKPVVIDFWAPWCGPCRMLAPALEQLAESHSGRFILAKVNIDEQPGLAQAFQVQSIPYVVALHKGQVVDAFLGALPPDQLQAWLERIVPSPADELTSAGRTLLPSDPTAAEQKFRAALALQADHAAAKIGLTQCLVESGRLKEARSLLTELEQRGFLEPEAERVKSELEIKSAAAESGGLDAARKAAAAEPNNVPAQIQLAEALAAAGKFQEALDHCLSLIQRDRAGAGIQAKDVMVKILNLTSNTELVATYRRKLASALY
jgi:putative thioredoxin